MPTIESKLPGVGTSIFTVMSALATERGAINLGQGFPDFPMSPELIGKVDAAMREGFNQYMPMQGYLPLRQVLSEKIRQLYGRSVDPEREITITPGGTYAIYTALATVLHPGDEVIVLEPAYDSYVPCIRSFGAVPVLVDLRFPGYRIDWDAVRARVSPRTKMIMINTPHNPTGSILESEDVAALKKLVAEFDLFILSDEVYEHLIFDGRSHHSMLRDSDLWERSFVCFSFGKVYHCTGWKLGYCVAPARFMDEFRKIHQFNVFSCHSPSQVALAEHLRDPQTYLTLGSFLQEKRDFFQEQMRGTCFEPLPTFGSYFQCFRYLGDSKDADAELVKRMIREAGVAAIPVSAFYQRGKDDRVLRFCFSKKEETLRAAALRLAGWS